MKCSACGGNMRFRDKTTISHVLEDGPVSYVIITDVPADVCEQCGETVYSPEVADRLQEILHAAKEKKDAPRTVEVPIYSLAKSA